MQSRKRPGEDIKLKDLAIIDGYNFIFKYIDKSGVDKERLMYFREKLITDLIQYKYQKDCDLVVVFDGSLSDNQERSREIIDEVEVVYSRRNETADKVIEEIVKKTHRIEKYIL